MDKNDTENGNGEKFDLLDVYFFKSLVKNRFFKPAVNVIFFIILLIIVYYGLISKSDLRFQGGIPFATTMIWDVWHPLLIFTLILLGRLWCFACPIGATGDWAQSVFSLKKKYPEKYRNLWVAVVFFLFIFAAERHLFMFTRNPPNTAALLLFFTGLAVVMGIVYEKRSFCRYICPIGLVLGVFSMLSATELRCKSKKTCREHNIKECTVGTKAGKACPVSEFPQTMERNNYCIMCMECVKSCSKDNIRISPRLPGADIVKPKRTHLDEAFLVHSIIIIFLFVLGMERFQFRNVIINFVRSVAPFDTVAHYSFFVNYWRNMWAITIFTLITLGAVGLMYLSTRASFPEERTRQRFIDLSYAFIPLSLSVYLAENTFRLVKGLLYIVENVGDIFGRIWSFTLDFDTINHLQILLLSAGFLFTIWAGYLISKRALGEEELQKGILAVGITAVVYLFIGVKILTLPIV